MGSMRVEASSSSLPNDWVNAPTRSFQPRVRIASAIASRLTFHRVDAVTCVEAVGERDRTVERHPAHQLAVEEVPGLAADLPDALVRLTPSGGRDVGQVGEEAAADGVERGDLVGQTVGGAEQLAVDVELPLVPRAVPGAHRPAAAPAGQVAELALGQIVLAPDAEHDLQVAPAGHVGRRRVGEVVEELVGLVRARGDPQRLERERGVTYPRVAVVPVS